VNHRRARPAAQRAGKEENQMASSPTDSADMRLLIASYDRYVDAQWAVDTLSDRGFPVERVSIIGSDLRLVEKVTGRLTVARAALAGALTGAWIGLLVGLVFSIVSPWILTPIAYGVLIGIGFGALWGAVAHALTRGIRDFASLQGLQAGRYDVVATDAADVEAAQRILSSAATSSVEGGTAAAHRQENRR
jgi:hypothetical protein